MMELHEAISDFSAETLQARREQDDILKELKEKTASKEDSYLTKLSFRCK